MTKRQQLISELRLKYKGEALVQRAATELETSEAQIETIFKKLYSKRAFDGNLAYIELSDLFEIAAEYGVGLGVAPQRS